MTTQRKKTASKICPHDSHNVRTHLEHIHPNKKHPEGIVITRHRHCAKNPLRKSHEDVLSFNDIRVTAKNFANLIDPPMPLGRLAEFPEADKYDTLIRGWTSYWNDIFKPKDPLDPNLVKGLMATESGFNEKAINTAYKLRKKHAHGLLQVRGETVEILKDHKGELNNHLIDININNLYDPSTNVCCGVRWLFRKKEIESAKLGREATWEETIIGYKGYGKAVKDGKNPKGLQKLQDYYRELLQN
jgi:hypothetical protein